MNYCQIQLVYMKHKNIFIKKSHLQGESGLKQKTLTI